LPLLFRSELTRSRKHKINPIDRYIAIDSTASVLNIINALIYTKNISQGLNIAIVKFLSNKFGRSMKMGVL
jgi:hypothetical protein